MAQLKNPKHELMARARAKGMTNTEAYLKAYPEASRETARKNAPAVMTKYGIHRRAAELLSKAGLTEEKLARRLNDHVDSSTESISLDATKHGLKLYGHGVDHDREPITYNPVQIIIECYTPPKEQDEHSR